MIYFSQINKTKKMIFFSNKKSKEHLFNMPEEKKEK
jgi:hypothetical protein